jgi:hypothetical protein
MALQVRLDVEDRQLRLLVHAQQLAQRRIRGDIVLGAQLALINVLVDVARHIGAAHRGILAATQEDGQLIADGYGLGEVAHGLGGTIGGLGALAAAVLARVLELTLGALGHTLQGRQSSGGGIADRRQLVLQRLDLISERRLSHGRSGGVSSSGYGRRHGHRGSYGCRSSRRRGRRRLLRNRLSSSGRGRSSGGRGWRSSSSGRSSRGCRGGGGGLLGNLLGSGGGGGVHRIRGGGISGGHFTASSCLHSRAQQASIFWSRASRFVKKTKNLPSLYFFYFEVSLERA